jgi:hypothetical protein
MIAKAAALCALIGSIAGGVWALDSRHVSAAEYRDFQWSVMKGQINDVRQRIFNSQGEERRYWERELKELMDVFCRKYPKDRECR